MGLKKLLAWVLCLASSLLTFSCSDPEEKSIADTQFAKGEFAEAVLSYSEELKTNPKDINLLFSRGRAYQELGQFLEAQADFDLALQQDPKNTQVLMSLSLVHLDQESFASALLYATKAEEVDGPLPMSSLLKGRAFHQLGMPEEALNAYGMAIQLDKNFAQAYFNRGILKVALKRTKEACEDFQQAASLKYAGAEQALTSYCRN
ncbi:MAG: tetratricopeptide repeat protein [Bacteroidetes bacterium]|nr:tetratricopeptide repeat protein [Bacteroidota bacterium]